MLSIIWPDNHFPSIFDSGTALTTKGTFFRIPTIMNVIIPLNKLPLPLSLLLLLLFTPPLSRDGGMVEDHGAPEAGKLPRIWARGCKETVSRQRVSGTKSPQLDSADEMRSVPGRVSTGAAGRILNSANPREIRIRKKAAPAAAKTREDTASTTREHKFPGGNRGNPRAKESR